MFLRDDMNSTNGFQDISKVVLDRISKCGAVTLPVGCTLKLNAYIHIRLLPIP